MRQIGSSWRRAAAVLAAVLVTACLAAHGGSKAASTYTHYYVVRHAEKADESPDPSISSPTGAARAKALAEALAEEGIDRIFVSDRKRTQETAAPTAKDSGVAPEAPRKAQDLKGLIEALKAIRGEEVLVVWHSNGVHEIVNQLSGTASEKLEPLAEWEFDKLFVVTTHSFLGKVTTHVERCRYGAESLAPR